ncbi:conserved hypothetical protein [Neospora caninum Liverpool]|uniref:Uncharacterized protein n=1 Tax=Neospora caninum (strain Liverpool) TaxID=572307 RepID=F0VHW3_NEOCL|nr:conserved hypothetical protein [Neospora caninum Liverpool]CBZ53324.1 conserved hypothetical protein [Neospora caninum Liverpool]|eukprot:XP_003883356.1 conserved hypothetical protein [Neospora caninum Liverpool]
MFTLIPSRLCFSVLVNQVASASLELRNTGRVAFSFVWTPEKTAFDTSNDVLIRNDSGIVSFPADTAVGGVDDGEASVQELEQRLCRRVMAQYINETLLHLVDSLSYSHMPDQRVERANIQAYTFEHVNSFYRVDGSEAIIKEFTKIRDDVRAFKEALPSEETNNGGPPHPAWSHHGPKNAHPGTDESLSLALLFDEIFMLDDIHLEEKRCFALRLQSLITTAQESRARYSRAAASLMESIIATLVPACCSAIADARDQAGQPPMMPQWLPSGFKLADASVSSAADIPDSRASQPSLSSTKPSDDIPTQRHSTQIEVKKPLHWSNKEGQVASRGGRLHTTNIPDWQAPAAEVLARNFSQYLETWDYDAVLSHANDVLLNNFADKLDNTGLDVLTQATPEKNLENMKVAAMKLLGDVCMKVDLEKAAPAIEDVLLELLGLICEEHDAVLRFLSTKEDIWDFIDEKLPEEWDSARGPQIAETSQETVVYFISDWARFMGLALDCIYEKQIDKVEREVVNANSDGDVPALVDERKASQEYNEERHITLLFHKWEGPIRYTTPEDIEVADHIEEVAVYWGAGPSLLSDMKEAIRTSHLLCYLGDALERCNMKDSKVGDNDMSGRSASISSTSELLSHVAALLPADLTPSRSVSTRSWSEHEDEDDSDQEEHNTRLEAIMGCEPSNKIMTIMAK